MRKSIVSLFIIAIGASTVLCACRPTHSNMISEVERDAEGESFSEVSYDKTNDIYELKSDERDLTFYAYGHVAENLLTDGSEYHTNYVTAVRDLYYDDIDQILTEAGAEADHTYGEHYNYYNYEFRIDSFDEIPLVADAINRADDIYAGELEFHDESWLDRNYWGYVRVIIDGGDVSKASHIELNGLGEDAESTIIADFNR